MSKYEVCLDDDGLIQIGELDGIKSIKDKLDHSDWGLPNIKQQLNRIEQKLDLLNQKVTESKLL